MSWRAHPTGIVNGAHVFPDGSIYWRMSTFELNVVNAAKVFEFVIKRDVLMHGDTVAYRARLIRAEARLIRAVERLRAFELQERKKARFARKASKWRREQEVKSRNE